MRLGFRKNHAIMMISSILTTGFLLTAAHASYQEHLEPDVTLDAIVEQKVDNKVREALTSFDRPLVTEVTHIHTHHHDHHDETLMDLRAELSAHFDEISERIAGLEYLLSEITNHLSDYEEIHVRDLDFPSEQDEHQDEDTGDALAILDEGVLDASAEEEDWFNLNDEFERVGHLPFYGDPDQAAVDIVYFYHYDCEACAVGDSMLRDIVDSYPQYRIVYRDLSTPDDVEARLALALWKVAPDSFDALHEEFLTSTEKGEPQEMMERLREIVGEETGQVVWETAFANEEDDLLGQEIQMNRYVAEAMDFDLVPRIHLDTPTTYYEALPEWDVLEEDLENYLEEQGLI